MEIKKRIELGRSYRDVETPGGLFISFIPSLFKGERGSLIMLEKSIYSEKKGEIQAVVVKEKQNIKGKYFVIRSAKNQEEKFNLFTLVSGGDQDSRSDRGWYKVKKVENGIILHDISSSWGSNRQTLVALKDGGYLDIKGNHGSGFKRRDPQPDFLIRLNFDGTTKEMTDLDVDLDDSSQVEIDIAPSGVKKEVRWLSWIGKHADETLPRVKAIVQRLAIDRRIVIRTIVCGEEAKGKKELTYPLSGGTYIKTGTRALANFYRPAPIDLYDFDSYLELYDLQNFFVNFCAVTEGAKNANYPSPSPGFMNFDAMKPIGKGTIINITDSRGKKFPLGEIIGNNLFVYFDAVNFLGEYSAKFPEDPFGFKILAEIIEEANKIIRESRKPEIE